MERKIYDGGKMEDNYKEKQLQASLQRQLSNCFNIIREYKKSKGENLKQGERAFTNEILIPQYFEGELTEEIKRELHDCFDIIREYKEKKKKEENSNNGRRGGHEKSLSGGKHLTIEDMLKGDEILEALEREEKRISDEKRMRVEERMRKKHQRGRER